MISRSELARLRISEKDSETGEIVKRPPPSLGGESQRRRRRSLRAAGEACAKQSARGAAAACPSCGSGWRDGPASATAPRQSPPRPGRQLTPGPSHPPGARAGAGGATPARTGTGASPLHAWGAGHSDRTRSQVKQPAAEALAPLVVADGQRGLLALRHGVLLAGQVTSP